MGIMGSMKQKETMGCIEFVAALDARQITNEAAAELLGLGPQTGQISRLRSGERKPGRALAYAIEREFGVQMSAWEVQIRKVS